MSTADIVLLVVAGVGAGLSGTVAGLASLVSYPALLAVGLPPVTANVTNTVALVCSTAGATVGSQPELHDQWRRVGRLGVAAVAGGGIGAALLLLTPSGSFELVVPWLIGLASLGMVLRRKVEARTRTPHEGDPARLPASVFAVGIYGGYFGAGAGVVMLAIILAATAETVARANAVKNVVLGLANGVAAVAFAAFGHVRWSAMLPLGIGLLAGGRVGPIVVRRVPATPLRIAIALAGVGLAVHLGLDAY